jgi:glucose-1-phosphate adenylyltransferase
MHYGKMLEHHEAMGADVTLATLPIDPSEVSRFGVVEVAKNGEVVGFDEKPQSTNFRSPFNPNMVDASMGIYLFNTDVLLPALLQDAEEPTSKHDFGHNILPGILGKYKMCAYNFVDENQQQALYWRDVGTLEAYFDANMDVASVSPVFNLYDNKWPIRTRIRQYPPAKFVFGEPGRTGMAINSIVAAGCIVSGAVVRNSVLSQDVRVNSYSEIDSSIVFSHVNIGRHCRIRRAIIDRDVQLPEGTVIGYDANEDKKNYFVTPGGLTVVTRDYSLYENPVASDFLLDT